MNDAAVLAMWNDLKALSRRVLRLENKVEFLRGQVKARLREEAEARDLDSAEYIQKYGMPPSGL